MIEEGIQLDNKAEFEKASVELIDKVTEVRNIKKSDAKLTKQIKENLQAVAEEFIDIEDIQLLITEAERLEVDPTDSNYTKLLEYKGEIVPLREEIQKSIEEGLKKIKAREYLVKIMRLGITFEEVAELRRTLKQSTRKGRKPKEAVKISLSELSAFLQGLEESSLDKTAKNKIEKHLQPLTDLAEQYEVSQTNTLDAFDGDLIEEWLLTAKKAGITLEGTEILEGKLSLWKAISEITTRLFSGEEMEIEGESFLDKAKRGIESSYNTGLKERDFKEIKRLRGEILDLCNDLKYKDNSLRQVLKSIESLEWVQKSKSVLKKHSADKEDFLELVSSVPQELKPSQLFTQVLDRSTGKIRIADEADIHATLSEYLDQAEVENSKDKLIEFAVCCRKVSTSERSERMFNLVFSIIEMFEERKFEDSESIVEQMFDMKFYDTKTFVRIEEIQGIIEKAKKTKGSITANKNKLNRSLEAIEAKDIQSHEMIKSVSRMTIEEAKKVLNQLEDIYEKVGGDHQDYINKLTGFIDDAKHSEKDLLAFKKKFPIEQLGEGFEGKKLEKLNESFTTLVRKYVKHHFSIPEVDEEIQKYSWMIKALDLLDPQSSPSKNITAWSKVLKNIDDGSGESTLKIAEEMKNKIERARVFDRAVKELKASSGKNKEKGILLKDIQEMLRDAEENLSQFDLGSSKNYLESVVKGVNERLDSLNTKPQLSLSELQGHLEYFKKTPLDLDSQISEFVELEKRASEFMEGVRTLSAGRFIDQRERLQDQYDNLGIIIEEWEEMNTAVEGEQRVIIQITSALDKEAKSLDTAQHIKDLYKSSIRYLRDIKMETRLLTTFLNLLKEAFAERQADGGEGPAVIEYIVLVSLAKESEELMGRLRTHTESMKQQIIGLADGQQFVVELLGEVKRHLEFNIHTLDIQGLSTTKISEVYKGFVDISQAILDFKVTLEIQEKEKLQKKLYPQRETKKRTAHVLESKRSVISPKKIAKVDPKPIVEQVELKDDDKLLEQKKKSVGRFGLLQAQDNTNIKPSVNRTFISSDLRSYYSKTWKNLMEDNDHLDISGLDVLMASKSLEKAIYDRIKNSPLDYDVLCTSITNTLRHIIGLKNISIHLRNENFKPNILLLYCDKPLVHLRTMDRNLGRPMDNPMNQRKPPQAPPNATVPQIAQINPAVSIPQKKLKVGPVGKGYMEQSGYTESKLDFADNNEKVEEVSYKHYRIFNGSLTFELNDKSSRTLESVDFISCSSYDRITKFTQIPRKISLKTTVSQNEFAQYITHVINSPKQYTLLTGWVGYSKTHSKAASYCKKNGCVASMQYSKTCKMFVFPLEALDARWLTQIPIYTTSAKIDLLYMMVLKAKPGISEPPIVPEPQNITTPNAYRVIPTPGHGKIALKPSNLDRIKERTKVAITGRFDDIPQKYSERAANSKPSKNPNKLQYLLDRANDIEQVPESVIEEENRIREQHAFGIKDKDYPTGGSGFFGGNLISSLKNDNIGLGMDTLLRKRPVIDERSNYFEDDSSNYGLGGIDKKEFVQNAVNSIQLPPSHYFLNPKASGGTPGAATQGNAASFGEPKNNRNNYF